MVCFYGLALTIVAALVVVPLLMVRYSMGLFLKLGLFCLLGAYAILRAILPRRDHFEPPGPRLVPEDQPRLFTEICGIANKVQQPEPTEVYLVPDVNAFVGQRGGFMGLGSRRVMGIGLPLMQVLTVAELRGVLAHEFGHFHGGDVAIGPWVYTTRNTLMRTLEELQHHSQALMMPFVWYAHLFFRVTHAVSRHQEVLADRVATDVAGTRDTASGLRLVHGASLAFVPYWMGTVEPVLEAGFLPPLAAGFDAFLHAPGIADQVAEGLKEQARSQEQILYDTHPPLAERLTALGVDPSNTDREPGPSSLSLLDDLSALESRLIDATLRQRKGTASKKTIGLNFAPDQRVLTRLDWAEVGAKVWVPRWERVLRDHAKLLAGVTPASLPDVDWAEIGKKLIGKQPNVKPLEAADSLVGIALAVALSRAGFTLESYPGAGHTLVGLGEAIEVFSVRESLTKSLESPASWRTLCTRAGISDLDLGSLGVPRPEPRA